MAYEYREISREGDIDEKGIRHYTRTFQVLTDNFADGPGIVAAYVPINLYASYVTTTETDLFALLKKKTARQVEPGHWEVTCEYDSAPFDTGNQSGSSSPGGANNQVTPDARPWLLRFGSNKGTKLLTKDLDNVCVLNSAGQPFDPPLEVPTAYPTIQITAYKATFSFSSITLYTNAINSDAWQGFAPRKLRCIEYAATTQYDNGAYFWQLDVTIEVHPDGFWNPVEILDAGTVYIESMAKPPQPILDSTGNPVTSPVPLNGSGQPLNAGEPCEDLVYRPFKAYREVPFAAII